MKMGFTPSSFPAGLSRGNRLNRVKRLSQQSWARAIGDFTQKAALPSGLITSVAGVPPPPIPSFGKSMHFNEERLLQGRCNLLLGVHDGLQFCFLQSLGVCQWPFSFGLFVAGFPPFCSLYPHLPAVYTPEGRCITH